MDINNQLSKNLQRLKNEKRKRNEKKKKQSLNRVLELYYMSRTGVNNTKKKNLNREKQQKKSKMKKIQIEEVDSSAKRLPDINNNSIENIFKSLPVNNVQKLVKTSKSFKKVANQANLKEYEYKKNKLKLFRDILKSCKPNSEIIKIISSLSDSSRDEIFKFYRFNSSCCPWEKHNMIEEIKRLLGIINREAHAYGGDNRLFNYLKNVDIYKLIKKHSKYPIHPRAILPMEVAY